MTNASLQRSRKGLWRLSGELDFDSVVALRPRLDEALQEGDAIDIDLGGLTRANSAGLALLLQWREDAVRRGVSLSILGVPQSLWELAGLSNVRPLLDLRDDGNRPAR